MHPAGVAHPDSGGNVGAVRRSVEDGRVHPSVVEDGGDVVDHLIDGEGPRWQVGAEVVVARHAHSAVLDHDDVETGLGGAPAQPLVDLQRRHTRAARDDDQRMGGLAAGAHVVQIELVGAPRRNRPAHGPDAGHCSQLFVHPTRLWRSSSSVSARHRFHSAGSTVCRQRGRRRQPRIRSAAISPISTDGAWVWPRTVLGITEASATRSPSIPRTRSCGSTTLASSLPIRQVPSG